MQGVEPEEGAERPRFPEMIETERLILRSPRAGDGAEINAAVREMYEELHLWMPWANHVPTVEETEANCVETQDRYARGEDFGIAGYRQSDGAFVLRSGLHLRDARIPRYEIGYWCRAKFQGAGYVCETVRALTRVGFEQMGAKRIDIQCDSRNEKSRRVAERCGYRLVAELKYDDIATDGSLRDTLLFSLTREEYDAAASDIP